MDNEILKMIDQVSYECQKFGYTMRYEYGNIFISTQFEHWRFEPRMGKIRLWHMSTHPHRTGEYHTQFIKRITMADIVAYMRNHEVDKYIGKGAIK